MEGWRQQLRASLAAPMRRQLQYRGQLMLREELSLSQVEEGDAATVSADGLFSSLLLVVKGGQRFAIGVCGPEMFAANTEVSSKAAAAHMEAPLAAVAAAAAAKRSSKAAAMAAANAGAPSRAAAATAPKSEFDSWGSEPNSKGALFGRGGDSGSRASKAAAEPAGSSSSCGPAARHQPLASASGAAELAGPRDSAHSAVRHPLADVAFQERAMRCRGWTPVLLPYWEWDVLFSSEPGNQAAKRVVLHKLDKALRLRGQGPE